MLRLRNFENFTFEAPKQIEFGETNNFPRTYLENCLETSQSIRRMKTDFFFLPRKRFKRIY